MRASVCLLALLAAGTDVASARRTSLKCADASEVSALQTAAVQQELMDAALGCGQQATERFNAFQTSFGLELRRSDKTLLTMFKRVYGSTKGDAAYNLFKTNMASKAEIRRVHGVGDFCAAADLVFAAALGPQKPPLNEFVAGVQINDTDETPVGKCDIRVAVTLQGAMAGPNIVPKPNPLRVAYLFPDDPAPARFPDDPAPAGVAQTPAAAPPAPLQEPQVVAQAPAEPPKEKKSGWLSGLFH